MSQPAPKPGAVIAFASCFLLVTLVSWWWAFQPPAPARARLSEIEVRLRDWDERTMNDRDSTASGTLRLHAADQPEHLTFEVQRFGYLENFKREPFAAAAAQKGRIFKLLIDRIDHAAALTSKEPATLPVFGVRDHQDVYFTLNHYMDGLASNRRWGVVWALMCTGLTSFVLWRFWQRRHLLAGQKEQL